MKMTSLLFASLLLGLYGCQQQTSTQQAPAPAEASVVHAEAAVAASAVTAPVELAEQAVEPVKPAVPAQAVAAKVEPVAAKPHVAEKPAPAVVQAKSPTVIVSPKSEPAPVAPAKEKVVQAAEAAVAKPEPVVKQAAVSEADAMAIAKSNNCLGCHAIDRKVFGPAWKDVAAKYRGDAKAEAYLVNKIATGGSGVWGSAKMPTNSRISEADRTTLARFVLNLK